MHPEIEKVKDKYPILYRGVKEGYITEESALKRLEMIHMIENGPHLSEKDLSALIYLWDRGILTLEFLLDKLKTDSESYLERWRKGGCLVGSFWNKDLQVSKPITDSDIYTLNKLYENIENGLKEGCVVVSSISSIPEEELKTRWISDIQNLHNALRSISERGVKDHLDYKKNPNGYYEKHKCPSPGTIGYLTHYFTSGGREYVKFDIDGKSFIVHTEEAKYLFDNYTYPHIGYMEVDENGESYWFKETNKREKYK